MTQFCSSYYCIRGEAHELDVLQHIMLQIQREKACGWMRYILEYLNDGSMPEHLYAAAMWDSPVRQDDCLFFHFESTRGTMSETWDFIASKFSSLQVYYMGEELDSDVWHKRDLPEQPLFTSNYVLEIFNPGVPTVFEYFETLEAAFREIEAVSGTKICTMEDVENLRRDWTVLPYHYINFKEIKSV